MYDVIPIGNTTIEIIDGDRGKNYPQQTDFFDNGYCLFLNAKNVTTTGFDFRNTMFISEERDRLLRKGKLVRGDIVLTTRGTVGNVALYDDNVPYDEIRINSGMVILRINENEYCNEYIYFLLQSAFVQNQINLIKTGSAQPQLPIKLLNNIELIIPPLPIQKGIAKKIISLQNKISKNEFHKKVLEQITQSIYQSWFNDFNYPDATGKMCISENLHKEVPQSWREMKFGEFLASHSEKIGDVEAPIYSTTNNGIALRDEKFNKNLSESQKNNKKIVKDDLIFGLSREILNFGVVTAKIGSVSPVYQIFKINHTVFLPFMLELEIRINMPNYMDILQLGAREGQGISKDYLLNKYILVPDMEVQKRFEEIYTVIQNKIEKLKAENIVLAEIRDTLLPKLMNGELPVEAGKA